MGAVKLIGSYTSLFCTRVEWALKLKEVQYEYSEDDIFNKSPLLLKHNPAHKKVPVLVHDDKPIAESLVILQYIDETWKDNLLLPQDPHERATALFWAKFADEKRSLSWGCFGVGFVSMVSWEASSGGWVAESIPVKLVSFGLIPSLYNSLKSSKPFQNTHYEQTQQSWHFTRHHPSLASPTTSFYEVKFLTGIKAVTLAFDAKTFGSRISSNTFFAKATLSDRQCMIEAFGAAWKEGEEKEKAIKSALESFAFLEKLIQGKKFFSVMEEVGGMKLVDAEKFPSLLEWAQNLIEIPLIKERLPPRDAVANYLNIVASHKRSQKQ
ncbi:unnamed protein product [Dovyalis caffra]|uniref:glutathione transferase n=1 Tax=Dovyalis caffra TaxID=77055 RepID=A0AAV1SIE4_9ROSI|nr:unnamed protein product [Dovyalis caffra]